MVSAIFRRTERFGYALLWHCYNVCTIVCGLSEMSWTLHLLFHQIDSFWQLLGTGNSSLHILMMLSMVTALSAITDESKPESSNQFFYCICRNAHQFHLSSDQEMASTYFSIIVE